MLNLILLYFKKYFRYNKDLTSRRRTVLYCMCSNLWTLRWKKVLGMVLHGNKVAFTAKKKKKKKKKKRLHYGQSIGWSPSQKGQNKMWYVPKTHYIYYSFVQFI